MAISDRVLVDRVGTWIQGWHCETGLEFETHSKCFELFFKWEECLES